MKQLRSENDQTTHRPGIVYRSQRISAVIKPTYSKQKDERVVAELEHYGSMYKVVLQKNEERNFDTSCNCDGDKGHPICVHKAIVLLQLLHNYGPTLF